MAGGAVMWALRETVKLQTGGKMDGVVAAAGVEVVKWSAEPKA